MLYDAIVVGCGPAGSTAAYELARRGFSVLALDKERFPRYKSCGGCISAKVRDVLDLDLSGVIENTVKGAEFTYRSGRNVEIMSDSPVGYNVMRDAFDSLLLKRAREAGVEVIEGRRVRGFAEGGESLTVTVEGGEEFRARFLVGADGAAGVTGRAFGFDPRKAAVSITSEVPFEGGEFSGRLFIDFGSIPYGYGWIFPKGRCLSVGVAGDAAKIGGSVKGYFDSFVKTHPVLKGLKVDERVGWTVPTFYDSRKRVVSGRTLLVGDTGHLVDPFLGEGIYYAIRTGKAGASVIAENLTNGSSDLAPYEDWLRKEVYPEFEACDSIANLVYNHPRLWYSIIEREPGIMERYYGVIRGEETNASFYQWVCSRVRSKPWKVLRRWIESRFLPHDAGIM